MKVNIDDSWKNRLKEEFDKEYFVKLVSYIKNDINSGIIIYPKGPQIFNAFNYTPFNEVKVVVLGQDPYHGPNQAHGLSFSVPEGVATPPSLATVFKELKADIGTEIPSSGNLERWAKQGVFLLNAVLTVRAGQAASHSKIGWAQFTDTVIKQLSDHREGIVFLLWGNFAKSKTSLIDTSKHYVLEAAHPSPLARGAFYGCKHFSQTNQILINSGAKPIEW